MISTECPYANRKILIKSLGEDLLPSAQPGPNWRPGPSVAAPDAGNRYIDLFGPLRSRSAFDHGAAGSVGWKRDEREDHLNAW